jgi:prolyl-tRNA editing enzyme YbaK/EbsC (Cys-tRNA(Pro) deacylase)
MNNKLNNLKKILDEKRADYSIYEDGFSLASAEEGAKHYGISLHETTPTLILKSGEQFYAAIICGDTRISFKKLKLVVRYS